MSVADLKAVVDRALDDRRFQALVTDWPELLCADYALSADEIDALREHDPEALARLGLDEFHVRLAICLS
jgi:hypothetical protein